MLLHAVRRQGKGLLYIAGAALAGVAVFLIIKKVTDGIWYLPNYAYFYLLLFTVLLQYLALSMTLKRFMKAKLDAFVAGLKELNRTRVARALQVEKESMEKAAKSEQLKVDLISNVSHDLKTPLTSMGRLYRAAQKRGTRRCCPRLCRGNRKPRRKTQRNDQRLFSFGKSQQRQYRAA